MDMAPQISIVIPVYNEYASVEPLVQEINNALRSRVRYEIVFVDDGSTDATADELDRLRSTLPCIRVESHGRNRGQSAAIRTGVISATAPVIAVLDGDGQNDPADIMRLYGTLHVADEVRMVAGERRRRRDNWIRRISSSIANRIRSAALGDGIRDTGCGLKVFYRDDFLALPAFDHMHRFLPALIQRNGGRVHTVPVNHRPRITGVSKYGVGNRLWAGIIDLLGVMWLKSRRV